LFGGETKSFDAASESFGWKMWERAEKEFAEFHPRTIPSPNKLGGSGVVSRRRRSIEQGKYDARGGIAEPRVGRRQAGNLGRSISLLDSGTAQFAGTNYVSGGGDQFRKAGAGISDNHRGVWKPR
jgi:hypothetical protein